MGAESSRPLTLHERDGQRQQSITPNLMLSTPIYYLLTLPMLGGLG